MTNAENRQLMNLQLPFAMQALQRPNILSMLQNQQIVEYSAHISVKEQQRPHHSELRGSNLFSSPNNTGSHQQYYAARRVALSVTDTIIVSCIVGTVVLVFGYYLLRKFCFEKRTTSRILRQHRITAARAEVVRLQGRACTLSQPLDVEQVLVSIEVVDPSRDVLGSAMEPPTVVTAAIIVWFGSLTSWSEEKIDRWIYSNFNVGNMYVVWIV